MPLLWKSFEHEAKFFCCQAFQRKSDVENFLSFLTLPFMFCEIFDVHVARVSAAKRGMKKVINLQKNAMSCCCCFRCSFHAILLAPFCAFVYDERKHRKTSEIFQESSFIVDVNCAEHERMFSCGGFRISKAH